MQIATALPSAWPQLVIGIGEVLVGIVLLARAYTIAGFAARRVRDVPAALAAMFLLRKRPATEAESTRYLGNIYSAVGFLSVLSGLFTLYAVIFGTPV
jgi:hypothetical protein